MGSTTSKSSQGPEVCPPKEPPGASQLSVSRYLQIHTCVKAAKKMNLYITWLCDFESNRTRQSAWSSVVAERLSEEFYDYLQSVRAKEFTETEINIYESLRVYSKEVRKYHERIRLYKNLKN